MIDIELMKGDTKLWNLSIKLKGKSVDRIYFVGCMSLLSIPLKSKTVCSENYVALIQRLHAIQTLGSIRGLLLLLAVTRAMREECVQERNVPSLTSGCQPQTHGHIQRSHYYKISKY